MATILYVDDEPSVGSIIADCLARAGHQALGATSVPEAMAVLSRGGIDLIVSDYRMPGVTGLEFLGVLAREGIDVPVIMLTGFGSIEHAVAPSTTSPSRSGRSSSSWRSTRRSNSSGFGARTRTCAVRSWSSGASARSSATPRRCGA